MSHSNIHRNRGRLLGFTLVEIMVALALLMLMMSFLFEFVISGQRLWSASEHKMNTYDNGQIVLDVIREDLGNMAYSNEVGKSMPFFKRLTTDNGVASMPVDIDGGGQAIVYADIYLFFSHYASPHDSMKTGVYPICYVYIPYTHGNSNQLNPEGWGGRLYRVKVCPDNPDYPNFQWVGFNEDFAEVSGQALTSDPSSISQDIIGHLGQTLSKEDNILMRHVSQFSLEPQHPSATGGTSLFTNRGYLKVSPDSIQCSLRVFSMDAVGEEVWEEAKVTKENNKLNEVETWKNFKELITNNEREFTKAVRFR